MIEVVDEKTNPFTFKQLAIASTKPKFPENFITEIKKKNYSQDWTAYNNSQMKEKLLLMDILSEILDYIKFPKNNSTGKKGNSIRDKIFCIAIQSYNTKSSRRTISDLEIARRNGYIQKTPHFNTLLSFVRDSSVQYYLRFIIEISGLPLKNIENDFACDSTGFSTSEYSQWCKHKWGKYECKDRVWMKLHAVCGVETNIITSVSVTAKNVNDTTRFKPLLNNTNKNFNIREISADKAYLSSKNLEHASSMGAIAFIPFKKENKIKPNKSLIWIRMLRYFTKYEKEFYSRYNKRSNIETTFHMIKSKFGSSLKSKSYQAMINEILAKCLVHNLCVLIQENMKLGVELNYRKCAEMNPMK